MANRISFGDIESVSERNNLIKRAVQEVIKKFKANYKRFEKVTDEDLVSFHSIFGETFEKALEIIEKKKLTYFHTKVDNGLYQVDGSSGNTYMIYPSVNYCPCPSYKYMVSGGSHFICKHVLATIVADVTKQRIPIEVTDEHFVDLIIQNSLGRSEFTTLSMTDQEDWRNRNPCLNTFVYPTQPQSIPLFHHGHIGNWASVPPQTMPWGMPPMSQPTIVRFTAGGFNVPTTSVKRKSQPSPDIRLPSKILVTEEKMAAHMQNLHISDVQVDPQEVMSGVNCKEEAMETDRLPKLIISNEIKNMKTETIIPESILKRLERPEMALVLWQPPPADLGSRLKELKKLSKTNVPVESECLNDKESDDQSNRKMEVESKGEKGTEIAMEAEIELDNVESMFRPINPVPVQQQNYFQHPPAFGGYSSFTKSPTTL